MTTSSRTLKVLSAFLFFSSFGFAQEKEIAASKQPNAPVDLGTLGGSSSQANAVNLRGGIVGVASLSGDRAQHAFLQAPGSATFQDLGTLDGGTNSVATAVNSSMQTAGYSEYADAVNGTVKHAFFYNHGVLTDIGTLGGASSRATGVNNSGHVVGFSLLSDEATTRAFWYDSSQHTLADLGALKEGSNSVAYGVNLAGLVVGSSGTGVIGNDGAPVVDAVIFYPHRKQIVDIGSLGASPAQATAINDYTAVVGFSAVPDGTIQSFYWKNGKMTNLGTLGGSYTQATAINNYGEVVGFSNLAGNSAVHAFVWTKSKGIVDLNTVLPANSGWELIAAYGVSLRGEIVGVGLHKGEAHAFSFTYPVF